MKKRFLAVAFLLFCFPAVAQLQPAVETYGTSALTELTLIPWDFRPIDSSATFGWYANTGIPTSMYESPGSGTNTYVAPLHLPAGAVVSTVELHACDTTASSALYWYLVIQPKSGASASFTLLGSTGVSATPGCQLFTFPLNTPITIDNHQNFYYTYLAFGESGLALLFSSGRVGYKLQVSPPPGTATFADVPTTHLFFQYVEALAAAGITSGCGGGNYCPDAAVTRGQMAVFLAKALGLHWAP